MSVEQVDPRPLQRFAAAVGVGTLWLRARNGRHQPIWRWAAHGASAEQALEALWPWLSAPKREQAERVVGVVHDDWLARGQPTPRGRAGRRTAAATLTRSLLLHA